MSPKQFLRGVLEDAKAEGVDNPRFVPLSKSLQLVGEVAGQPLRRFSVPRTPSCSHARDNARSNLRKLVKKMRDEVSQ